MHSSDEHCNNLFRTAYDVIHLRSKNHQLIQVTDKKRTTANGELQIHRLRGWAELELSSRDTNLTLKLSDLKLKIPVTLILDLKRSSDND